MFLALTALVEVLDDDSDKHVEHKEADEQQEWNEVGQTPLVVICLRLQPQQQQAGRRPGGRGDITGYTDYHRNEAFPLT